MRYTTLPSEFHEWNRNYTAKQKLQNTLNCTWPRHLEKHSSRISESMPQHASDIQPGRRMWICVLVLKFSLPQCSIHSQARQVYAPVIMCFDFSILMSYENCILYCNSQLCSLELIVCLLYITESDTKKIQNNNHQISIILSGPWKHPFGSLLFYG